jgi:hypothetical protein
MAKFSPEEFILRAVKVLPSERSRHIGLRRNELDGPFAAEFGAAHELDEVLGRLILEGKLVAVHLVWRERPENNHSYHWSSTIEKAVKLLSYPDPSERNPMLYFPDSIPGRIKNRVSKLDRARMKILAG